MQRYHNLDFLRAFAMIMGLAIHAPLLFWQPDFAKMFGIENIAPAEPNQKSRLTISIRPTSRSPIVLLASSAGKICTHS